MRKITHDSRGNKAAYAFAMFSVFIKKHNIQLKISTHTFTYSTEYVVFVVICSYLVNLTCIRLLHNNRFNTQRNEIFKLEDTYCMYCRTYMKRCESRITSRKKQLKQFFAHKVTRQIATNYNIFPRQKKANDSAKKNHALSVLCHEWKS